jgi:hypothetical protein
MILAEGSVVIAKANQELRTQVQQLQADQRRQTEVLNGLLTDAAFGLPTTVLNDSVPSGQTFLDLLDLPGHYSRLIGNLCEPYANEQGRLSILAPTILTTRGALIESIERQLSRPNEYDLNAAYAYLNVAMSRVSEAKRRGVAIDSAGRILKRSIETIFHCELSGLRDNLPAYLKDPVPIVSNRTMGLMDDLQNRRAIVFRGRLFDFAGHQIQDMQVPRDHLPATVLVANAMNTSKELDDLPSQGNIPRLLKQEIKERKPFEQNVEPVHSKVLPSSSKEFGTQSSSVTVPLTPAITNLGKRKDNHFDGPSPTPALAQGLVLMPDGDVLHPFAPQSYMWDDLWREQDGAAQFVVVAKRHEKEQVAEADKAAVREVCTFFIRMKLHTSLFKQKVDWRYPGSRLTDVLDKANRKAANSALAAPARKSSTQRHRSSAGLGRDSLVPRTGLAVEWNLEIDSSWVWNDNQDGATKSDPQLLTRLLQEACYLPDESDYLTKGKAVLPIDMLSSTYKRFLKGGKGKGKASKVNPDGYLKEHHVPLRKPSSTC